MIVIQLIYTHLTQGQSASQTASAIAGSTVGVLVAVFSFCAFCIVSIYCCQKNKSHRHNVRPPRSVSVVQQHERTSAPSFHCSNSATSPTFQSGTFMMTHSVVQKESPPMYFPAQTHNREAPPDYNEACHYPRVSESMM